MRRPTGQPKALGRVLISRMIVYGQVSFQLGLYMLAIAHWRLKLSELGFLDEKVRTKVL